MLIFNTEYFTNSFIKMKALLLTYIIMAVTCLDFGLAENDSEDDLTNYLESFLIIKNTQKYCEKNHLLMAQGTDQLFNLSKLLNICESKKECDFISYCPKRQLRNSIHYENEEALHSTGANWVCSGDDWMKSRPRKYWVTAVKNEHLQKQMKSYDLSLNMSGECDEENVLMQIRKPVTPSEASQECDRIPSCQYIIFNYTNQIGKNNSEEVRALLCSKIPLGRLNKLGFLLAKKQLEPSYTSKAKPGKKEISLKESEGGPVTSDEFYKDFEKGDIVYADNL